MKFNDGQQTITQLNEYVLKAKPKSIMVQCAGFTGPLMR